MATSLNTAVAPRDAGYQGVGVLRRTLAAADFPTGSLVKTVGALPAGAVIIGGILAITTAFTGTASVGVGYLDFDGTTTNAAAYGSAVSVAAAGNIPLDELAATTAAPRSVPTQVIVTANAAATAGSMDVIIWFVTKNPTSGAAA